MSNFDDRRPAPAYDAAVVTPNDSTTFERCRALYVGSAGNVVVTMKSGNQVTFTGVVASTILPISVTAVKATGTTASGILALY